MLLYHLLLTYTKLSSLVPYTTLGEA